MKKIPQESYRRQRCLEYAGKHGVTEAANRYGYSRKTVYKWRGRWDGTPQSLNDRSRRPHHSPTAHTEAEIRLARSKLKKHRWTDLLLAYQEAREKGYSRSYGAFKRLARKLLDAKPARKKKQRGNKPYERASYPGQKVQIDVKYVPRSCAVDGRQYYQFTAVDECTRWCYREMYDERSTYSARDFLMKLVHHAPFGVRMVQTDNGAEFTNALLTTRAEHKSLFEQALEELGILYRRIRIATPRHNGKVERQHRTDMIRFYSRLRMFSLEDGRRQLAVYQRASLHHIKTCLQMRSPMQVLQDYLAVM